MPSFGVFGGCLKTAATETVFFLTVAATLCFAGGLASWRGRKARLLCWTSMLLWLGFRRSSCRDSENRGYCEIWQRRFRLRGYSGSGKEGAMGRAAHRLTVEEARAD